MPDIPAPVDFTFIARTLLDLKGDVAKLDNKLSSLTNDLAMLQALVTHFREAELQALFDLYRDLRTRVVSLEPREHARQD